MRKLRVGLVFIAVAAIAGAFGLTTAGLPATHPEGEVLAAEAPYEVWLVDQSNSPGLLYGGAIHIFDGPALAGERAGGVAPTATIDLGGDSAAFCLARTGANPVRPHMLFFNPAKTHAVLGFVASGHVLILDTNTHEPVGCVRASPGAGGARQAHAAVPSPDGRSILLANQNGKLLERIDVDYATNTYLLNGAATINLATCTTPNGMPCQAPVIRPDNAPICPIIDSTGSSAFVTLRGGGLFVVDPRTTPMSIIGEYDAATVHGNGCGGQEAGGSMWIDSGGATTANLAEFDVYRFPLTGYSGANLPNVPYPVLVYRDDVTPDRDAHGLLSSRHDRYMWVMDRGLHLVEIFDVASNDRVGTLPLVLGEVELTPDLADISPSGHRIFVSLRGPNPLSGDPHVSRGVIPGIAVIQVTNNGQDGVLKSVVPISNLDSLGIERADAHGIRVLVK